MILGLKSSLFQNISHLLQILLHEKYLCLVYVLCTRLFCFILLNIQVVFVLYFRFFRSLMFSLFIVQQNTHHQNLIVQDKV